MVKLRDYQQEAVNAILTNEKGIVSAATGSGKTTMMSEAIASQHEADGKRTLVLVHTRALVWQTASRLSADTGQRATVFFGEQKESLSSSLVVATYQSVRILIRHGEIPSDHFGHIHVDEAHNVRSATYRRVIRYFTPDTLHGYTATLEGRDEDTILAVFGKRIYDIGLLELIDRGFLSPMRILVSLTDQKGIKDSEEYNRKKFETIRRMTDQNSSIVKTLHFYSLNKRFEHVREWNLLDAGTYAAITGKTTNRRRKQILDRFEQPHSGLNHLLANKVLNEGVDLPITNSLVFHESLGDYRVITQRFGRGLRVWDANRDQTTLIMIFVDKKDHRHLKALRAFVDGVTAEGLRSQRVSIEETNSSEITSKTNDVSREQPITITFVDVTEHVFKKATQGTSDYPTLEEFVSLMVENKIDSHSKYRPLRWQLKCPGNPARYYGVNGRTLWNSIRAKLGKRARRTYGFTFDEFVEDMIKMGVRSSGEYKQIWRTTCYCNSPHDHLGMTAKELWNRIRREAGERVVRTDFSLEEFVGDMVKARVTSVKAFNQRKDEFEYPSNPHERLGMSASELFSIVRKRLGVEIVRYDYTVDDFVNAMYANGIQGLTEYDRSRQRLRFGKDPHKKLGMSSKDLFAMVRARFGSGPITYSYTPTEFIEAMVENGISSQSQFNHRRKDFNFGTDPHRKLKMGAGELWSIVRDRIARVDETTNAVGKSA